MMMMMFAYFRVSTWKSFKLKVSTLILSIRWKTLHLHKKIQHLHHHHHLLRKVSHLPLRNRRQVPRSVFATLNQFLSSHHLCLHCTFQALFSSPIPIFLVFGWTWASDRLRLSDLKLKLIKLITNAATCSHSATLQLIWKLLALSATSILQFEVFDGRDT